MSPLRVFIGGVLAVLLTNLFWHVEKKSVREQHQVLVNEHRELTFGVK